ncbi:MAG: NUDIX domain-containing protein, partial [Hyphomicrobiales bacterium]
GETVEAACRRELMEETGVRAGTLVLTGVYSDPERDARGHTSSVAFAGRIRSCPVRAGDDAGEAAFVADWRRQALAFDHARIIADAEAALSPDGGRATLGPREK